MGVKTTRIPKIDDAVDVVGTDLQPDVDLDRWKCSSWLFLAKCHDLRPLVGAEIMYAEFAPACEQLKRMADRGLAAVVRADEYRNIGREVDHDIAQSPEISDRKLLQVHLAPHTDRSKALPRADDQD